MRWSSEITGRRKGTYLLNLDYKRKNFLPSIKARMKTALKETQAPLIEQVKTAASLNDLLTIDSKLGTGSIKGAMVSTYQQVGTSFASETYKNLKSRKDDVANMERVWLNQMEQYVEDRAANRITWITETTEERFKKIVKSVVAQAQAEGLSIDKAAKLIEQRIGFDNNNRALRIARTEIIAASNQGSQNGAKSTGLPMDKVWLTRRNKWVRDSHKEMEGKAVDIDGYFQVPILVGTDAGKYDRMQHPGDPSGSAGNVIECGCTQLYKRKF